VVEALVLNGFTRSNAMADRRDLHLDPTRRNVLQVGLGGLALLGATRALGAPAKGTGKAAKGKAPRKIPIAVQLYSIRNDCAKDFDAALAKVAELGFDGVEFAGYHSYKDNPEGLRKKLDELKLRVAGTHIGAGSFAPDKIKHTIAFHKTIGCKFLIVPGDGRFSDPEKSKEYAKVLTDAAAALKPEGLFCGHHNHTKEFEKLGDKTYWDLFAERTPKEVILQNDLGWTHMAGLDPVETLKRYPGRTKSAHFKAKLPKGTEGKKPFIGQDQMDWKNIIITCDEVAGTEWFTLEQEDYDGLPPIEAVKTSFAGLKKILASMDRA
jgi:sugar phosphate isomerase/epimerase